MLACLPVGTGAELDEQYVTARFLANPCEEAFCDLFRAFSPRLLRYFRVRGCDPGVAEELTQDVLLTVYRRCGSLRDATRFRAWLFKIARNALLASVRASGRQPASVDFAAVSEDQAVASPDPLSAFRLSEWMSCLEEPERQAMLLRFVDELEYHEIAQVLGAPIGTIQWRIFRAKRKIAKFFGQGI